MLGYLYQSRYALLRALQEGKGNPSHTLSIEKFDDVAFEDTDNPLELIQTKHHSKPGDTSDMSVDTWKTLGIWIGQVKGNPQAMSETRFTFLTTSTAAPETALSKLRMFGELRDVDGAQETLLHAAKSSTNSQTQKAREAFLDMDSKQRKLLIANIWVFDAAPNIVDVREELEELLFYAAPSDQLTNFVDYLEGWWLRKVIGALTDSPPPSIPLAAIQSKIADLRETFQAAKLPLDDGIDAMPPIETLPEDERDFVRQMKLIGLEESPTLAAVHDFYRASEQRSRWARENLLLDGEVDRYDRALYDAWKRKFHSKVDEVRNGCSEDEKKRIGRSIFFWAGLYSKPFRNREELWLSSGSYQILADSVRLGWHPEFNALMNEEGNV